MTDYDVSVVIPTYNREDLLPLAVRSCRQSGLKIEVLVVDDGSSDNTQAKLENEFDLNNRTTGSFSVNYFHQTNAGVSAARNLGLRHASGRFVKFLDSDDVLIKGALAKEVDFAKSSLCDVVVTGWRNDFYSDSEMRNKLRAETVTSPPMERGVDDMLLGNSTWTAAALYRTSSIKDFKWNVDFSKAEEWLWTWSLCFSNLKFMNLNIPSAVWNHYQSAERLTSIGDPFDRSSRARVAILERVHDTLLLDSALSEARQTLLSRYMHLDAIWSARNSLTGWKELSSRILSLNSDFLPDRKQQPTLYIVTRIFGYVWGVYIYSKISELLTG